MTEFTPNEFEQKIIEARKEGLTYKEIQERLDCSQQKVYATLWKAGLTNRSGRRKKLSDEDREEIARLRSEENYTYMELATQFDVSQPVINKVLRQAGLTGNRAAKTKQAPPAQLSDTEREAVHQSISDEWSGLNSDVDFNETDDDEEIDEIA